MKINLPFLQSGYRSSNALNTALQRIISAFDNTLSRDGTSPNEMLAPLDMNSNRIINLGAPVGESDAVRLQDILNLDGGTIDLAGKANTDASNVGVYRDNWLQEIGAASVNASNLTPANVADWASKLGLDPKNRGFWNASTNVPELESGVGTEGDYYRVSVDGTTELDGIDDWIKGDTVVFSDGAWVKIAAGDTGPNLLYVTVEDHGGKANDPTFDNTPAILAAEAWMTAKTVEEPGFRGVLQFRGGVDYYFKGTLLMNRMGGAWQGNRTRLIYNGESTTRDLIVFGHYNGGEALAGKPQIRDVKVDGLQILSTTKMTAGWAVRTRSCIESTFNLELQTQRGYEELGHNLWNGLWSEWSSTTVYEGITYVAQNTVIAINGAPGLAGGKSDVWFKIGKVAGGQIGCHIGGGFGGIWFMGDSTFISNRKHVLIDQALTAENNREVMFKGTTFDYTNTNGNGSADTPGDVGIDVADASEVFIDITDCWIAGAHGAHIIVRAVSSAFINCSGNRWFLGKPHPTDPTLLGHAIVTDSATSRIFINGGQANAFPGIVFRSRVANHNLNFADVHTWNCPAGVYDNAFVSTTDTTFRPVSGATWTRSGWFDNNVLVGPSVDQDFYLRRSGVDPVVNFDAGDFFQYLKGSNRLELNINGSKPLAINSGGIAIAGSPHIFPVYVYGTLDGAGARSGSLGVPQARILYGFVSITNGNGSATQVVQVQADGTSYYIVSPDGSGDGGKAYKGLVWCLA